MANRAPSSTVEKHCLRSTLSDYIRHASRMHSMPVSTRQPDHSSFPRNHCRTIPVGRVFLVVAHRCAGLPCAPWCCTPSLALSTFSTRVSPPTVPPPLTTDRERLAAPGPRNSPAGSCWPSPRTVRSWPLCGYARSLICLLKSPPPLLNQ